jgi:hypothetical protein
LIPFSIDFYDPDGYYFDQEGFDEFGGYYEGIYYYPGEGNKHEFEDFQDDDYEDDDLLRQFERGENDYDEDDYDEVQERMYEEFKKKEKVVNEDDVDEEEEVEKEQYYHPDSVQPLPKNNLSTAAVEFIPRGKQSKPQEVNVEVKVEEKKIDLPPSKQVEEVKDEVKVDQPAKQNGKAKVENGLQKTPAKTQANKNSTKVSEAKPA